MLLHVQNREIGPSSLNSVRNIINSVVSITNVYKYLFGSGDELPDLTMFAPQFVFISLCKRNKYFYMYFSPNKSYTCC